MRLPPRPAIYELNTAAWLAELGRPTGRVVALSDVPGQEWDRLAALRIDAVWLMGVWRRSAAGRAIALADDEQAASYRRALPGLGADDVLGSPYCVREYEPDAAFGGPDALDAARSALASRGIGLILDFVPNHVAPDHPWTTEHPELLIGGTSAELATDPASFLQTAGGVLANGRDPYFPAWGDVVQVNAFSPGLRDAAVDALVSIGRRCDGVRCDMAMLLTNEIFARTWGDRAGPAPPGDFWPEVIGAVRERRPELAFIAEVYWDMEWTLQQQGFDFCMDKRLYERLVGGSAESVRANLQAPAAYQERLVRFIENHDEPRAADAFAPARGRAAAVVMSTLQGARLYHDGQLDGLRTRIPVQLARGPVEPSDRALRAFYDGLLRAVADSGLRHGDWRLCDCAGWSDNHSAEHLLAWCWRTAEQRHLVVVNFSADAAQGRVRLPWSDLGGAAWQLRDALSGRGFEREGDELRDDGLYVGMGPWECYMLALAA